jgi:uncharacterized membrane protein
MMDGMTDLALARALHVVGVAVWIGGVAMVTAVVLPAARAARDPAMFERVERRFAAQTRWTLLIVGISGLYMAERLGLWPRFALARFWWMHAMVLLWLVYALALFVLEPFVLRRRFATRLAREPDAALARMQRHHWVLVVLSLLTVAGAAAGSHGFL